MTDQPRDPAARRPDGMPVGRPFPKGVSGNPAGLPRAHAEFRALIRQMTPQAVQRLRELVDAGDLDAIKFVVEQGWGKAVTAPPEEGSGENTGRIEIVVRREGGA